MTRFLRVLLLIIETFSNILIPKLKNILISKVMRSIHNNITVKLDIISKVFGGKIKAFG